MWRFYLLVPSTRLLDSLGCIAPHARREANVRLWPVRDKSVRDPEPPVAFLHTGHSRIGQSILRRAAVQCLKLS
jgi:hypothetical protein